MNCKNCQYQPPDHLKCSRKCVQLQYAVVILKFLMVDWQEFGRLHTLLLLDTSGQEKLLPWERG